MQIEDLYFKKKVSYKHADVLLDFEVSQELFSSQNIDVGTQRLLRSLLFEKIDSYQKVLDVGCGYGPIGITLKAVCPTAQVHMVDRDALAVSYAQRNAELNGFDNIKTYGSLVYDQVSEFDFDLIVSNIPAKVGQPVLDQFLKQAQQYLTKNGKVIIVVVDSIAEYVHQQLTTDERIHITFHRSWPGHHVYHYQFVVDTPSSSQPSSSFDSGVFFRNNHIFNYSKTEYDLMTSYDLVEFDQLSYDTELILDNVSSLKINNQNVLIINPGQGHIPQYISRTFRPQSVDLVSRDLLSLKTAHHNLEKLKVDSHVYHQVGYALPIEQNKPQAIIGVFPEKLSPRLYQILIEQIVDQLDNSGTSLLGSSSTVITHVADVLKEMPVTILFRHKQKGRSVIGFRKN